MRPVLCILAAALSLSASVLADTPYDIPDDHTQWPDRVFRCAYKNVGTRAELAVLDTITGGDLPAFLDRFWKRRDPSPTTEANEFKEQFTDRVRYALRHFRAVSVFGPWDQRGDVYIQFGPPSYRRTGVHHWFSYDKMREARRQLGLTGRPYLSLAGIRSRYHFEDTAFGEIWYYDDLALELQFQGEDFDYRMVPHADLTGEVQDFAVFADDATRLDSSHARYEVPVGTEELRLAVECYPFRREDGRYDVYVASALPLRSIANPTAYPAAEVTYAAHLTVFDSSLTRIWSDSASVRQSFDRVPRGTLAQNQWRHVMPPGFFTFAAEIDDRAGKKHAVSTFDRWLVPYLDSAQLELSPLVIAADIRPATATSSAFIRNDREIVPMPGRVFKDDQPIAFYHEVYNLAPNDSGSCIYQVEYAIYDDQGRDRTVLASREIHSAEHHTFQAGRIPAGVLQKGRHILEVQTTDLVTGTTKTALAGLKIE